MSIEKQMEWLTENIDIIATAPIAVIILVFIYLHHIKITKIIENQQKIIERLIDKI